MKIVKAAQFKILHGSASRLASDEKLYGGTLEINSLMSVKEKRAVWKRRAIKQKYWEQTGRIKTLNTMSAEEIDKIEKHYGCKIQRGDEWGLST